MLYLSPLPPSCSSVGSGAFLGVCGFLVFLASSARSACASSFCFCSAVCLRSIFGLAAVANRSVKPTRLRRAAYFRSLAPLNPSFIQAHVYSNGIQFLRRCAALGLPFLRASPAFSAPVSFFKCCAASVAQCFFTVCARRQVRVTRFGFWL